MESLLWMLDLVGVAYLCFWALREDRKEQDEEQAGMRKAAPRRGKD